MSKTVICMLLLLNLNLSAGTVDIGLQEYKKGNVLLASELYTKACENGNMHGCIYLGILHFAGEGVEENQKKAKKLFVKACKKRYAKGCFYLAAIYKRGAKGVERNIRRAKYFYAQGCKMGYTKSCEHHNLIREKREVIGSGANTKDLGYTYTTEIYGG